MEYLDDPLPKRPDECEKNECLNGALECPICFEELKMSNMTRLKCFHAFDYDCILEWYKSKANTKMARRCPVCRKNGGYLPIPYNTKHISDKNVYENIHFNPESKKNKKPKHKYNTRSQSDDPFLQYLQLLFQQPIDSQPNSNNSNSNSSNSNSNEESIGWLGRGHCDAKIKSKKSPKYGKACNKLLNRGFVKCGIHRRQNR